MKMDEYDGKNFLAAVRGADFAHAGEAESIDLVFSSINAKPTWRVLDVGCGRGGTANYVHERGWGKVVGVDIDEPSIAYAQAEFPGTEFAICAMEDVGEKYPSQFDLIYLFNVFYASCDKRAAMRSFRRAVKQGGMLCIFDYVYYKSEEPLPVVFQGQMPATLDEFQFFAVDSGWNLIKEENLDQQYMTWYQKFLAKFADPVLTEKYPAEVVASVRRKYEELLESLQKGVLGGILFLARQD